MATMDSIEALNTKALREKCKEYGLPNIPITDTSRKLLIKRLVKAIESGEKPQSVETENPKTRRETVHVIKVNVEKETTSKEKETPSKTKSFNNRKTIDALSATPNYEKELPSEIRITQRRSGRITPLSQLNEPTPTILKRKINVRLEEEEDDDDDDDYDDDVVEIEDDDDDDEVDKDSIPIPFIVDKSSKDINRQTRAPSLSKSVTVTTSYVRDTPPKEVLKEIDEPEYEEDKEYEEEKEILESKPVIEPIKPKYIPTSKTYDMPKPFVQTTEKLSYPYSNTHGSVINEAPFRTSLSNQVPTLSYKSTASRRYTTGPFKNTPEGENRTFVHHHVNENKTIEKDEIEAPYLSEFARRLSSLKAERIADTGSLFNSNENEEILCRQSPPYYTSSRITSRRSISQKESIGESLYKFLSALNQKYNLKMNFIIFAIILAIIFIFVLLF